jgi:oleate hydratase
MKKLLALVPSTSVSGRTVLKDIEKYYEDKVCQNVPVTHVLAQGDQGPRRTDARDLGLTLIDRMKLTMLLLRSEESLSRKRINQIFNKPFFDSTFWIAFSTLWAARSVKIGSFHNAKME